MAYTVADRTRFQRVHHQQNTALGIFLVSDSYYMRIYRACPDSPET